MFFKHLIHLQITASVSLLLNCCGEVSRQRKNMSFWLMTFAHFRKKYKTKTELVWYTASLRYQSFHNSKTMEITGEDKMGKMMNADFTVLKNTGYNSMQRDVIYSTRGHKCLGENSSPCHLKHWRRYSAGTACSKENTWFPTPSWAEWKALGWQSISEFSISLWYNIKPERRNAWITCVQHHLSILMSADYWRKKITDIFAIFASDLISLHRCRVGIINRRAV